MESKRLSKDDFYLSMELCPRIVIELIITNSDHEIFLLLRDGEPYNGDWHLPGGFLLKNETIEECVYRLLGDEVGVTERKDYDFIGVFETVGIDPRGHIIHYVVHFDDISCNNTLGKAEYHKQIPDNVIPYQIPIIEATLDELE